MTVAVTVAEDLLRRLAANDEPTLRAVLSPNPAEPASLDRRTRALVRLSALMALGAGPVSLRWAVEQASATGLDAAAVVHVLLAAAAEAGTAQTVENAPRLALALDMDVDHETDGR